MIKAINPVSACGKMNCNLNSKPKKTSNAHSIVTSNVNREKLPLLYYQPVFKGENFHVINSQRKFVDYGKNLYIGAYGLPFNRIYSVLRDRAKAEDLELNGVDLSNYSFEKSTLFDCELKGAKLENTTFENSNLWACKFNGAKMRSVNFRHTNLCDADFRGAEFGRNVDMSGADLMGADLRDTDLKM